MRFLEMGEVRRLTEALRDVFAYVAALKRSEPLAEEIQNPKIPPALSQSLAVHILRGYSILGEGVSVHPSYSGGDLSGEDGSGRRIKIEVKATGTSGFQQLGLKDLEADVLVWIHFGAFFEDRAKRQILVCWMPKPATKLKGPTKLSLETFLKTAGSSAKVKQIDLVTFFETGADCMKGHDA